MAGKKGHHGGAWKVAYADFVTAMMALFLVLWLAAQDQKIKEAVERAFRNPFISLTKGSAGLMRTKHFDTGKGSNGKLNKATLNPVEVMMMRRLQQELARSLTKLQQNQEEPTVQLNLTPEGLRITIFDRARKPTFEADSAKLTDYGSWILSTLAWEISRYKNFSIEIEGHTEKGHPPASPVYGNWELSADRANAGRRKLIEHGVRPSQIRKVAGFADTVPLEGHAPDDPVNRRLTLLLRVQSREPHHA